MKKNLSGHEIDRYCAFCEHASPLISNTDMLCFHRGVVGKRFHCHKFRYDPLKRVPKRRMPLKNDPDPIEI